MPAWFFYFIFSVTILGIIGFCFCVFFDQAVLTRQGTLYHVPIRQKKIALTFDDGPSPIWTPQILDALRQEKIKGTFFMTGRHVLRYPDVARQVAHEGHEIENHGYAHNILLYYREEEIEEEIKYTEHIIRNTTGVTTQYFRPPKAWLQAGLREKIKSMGYEVVLWSLNSKDWVSFSAQNMVSFISQKVQPGDIILFHDSGAAVKAEGGDRTQTVLAIRLLKKALGDQGFEFVTVQELVQAAKEK